MSKHDEQPVTDELYVSTAGLAALATDLLAAGREVIAPAVTGTCESPAALASAACLRPDAGPELIEYAAVEDPDRLALGRGMPSMSLKGFFLPQNEALFSWRQRGASIEIAEATRSPRLRVVLGAKPCDAAALEILDRVMDWDYVDELWNGRRAATTILTLACPVEDSSCFCYAVGAEPDGMRGADARLTPVDDGYLVTVATEKGRALIEAHAQHFTQPPGDLAALRRRAADFRAQARKLVKDNLQIDAGSVRDWVDAHFDDPLLAALGVRCNGCGACATVCPTCHCFDIVDEPDGVGCGTRRRCWDTCQTGEFTAHASGHNPREDQNARFRQRVNHKFAIYPLRFGEVLCTGCGRCTRACHAGQDLVEILRAIDVVARRGQPLVVGADGEVD